MNNRPQLPSRSRPADWKLPPGVAPGTWDYTHGDWIADDYDAFLANTPLTQFDARWLAKMLPPAHRPGALVADLGCGTGRTAASLAALGYRLLGIDLSQDMLRHASQRGGASVAPIHQEESPQVDSSSATIVPQPWLIRGNLVTLECLANEVVDHAICLFSTLGMVRQRDCRRRALSHVARILKPNGRFVLHCHNRWAALRDPGGIKHLWHSWRRARRDERFDFGDRVYAYRGLPNMFLHSYGRHELVADLSFAGLAVVTIEPLSVTGDQPLKRPWWCPSLRAGGFMVLARRAVDNVQPDEGH